MDATGDDRTEECSILQHELAAHWRQEETCAYPDTYHQSAGAYIEGRAPWKSSVHCSNHVVGWEEDDDPSRGQGVFTDGPGGREHADVVWRGEKAFHRVL